MAGVGARRDEDPHHPFERRVDLRLPLVRDRPSFGVRALHEPHADAKRVQVLKVLLAAAKRGLQHDAERPMTVPPQRVDDLQRGLRVARALHVEPDEEAGRLRPLEDPAEVLDRSRPVHVEAESRQLQRNVAVDPRSQDGVDDLEVVACRGLGLGRIRDALAQMVEGEQQPPLLDGAGRVDRIVERLAGDEAAREAGRVAHADARRHALQ